MPFGNGGTATNGSTITSNQAWLYWTGTAVTSVGPGLRSLDLEWVQTALSSTTGSTLDIWTGWCGESPRIARARDRLEVAVSGRAVSAEERAQWAAREAELKLQYDTEVAARKLANAKAEVLLRQLLTPQQQEDLETKRCFYLHSGDKKYRIDRGRTGNVKLVDERDQVVESYCIHPAIDCPDADTMLAQKLLLETDIETFERVANITARSAAGRNRNGQGRAQAQG